MSLRTFPIGPVLFILALTPACAQRQMRAQAAVLAEAGARLERETAEFAAARAAVVRLRQRNLVERQQQIAEQGQFNARTLHFWKLARDPERDKQLALFDGLTAAAAAAAAVQDRAYEWEESVVTRTHALTLDPAALHRFVQQLVILASPPRFIEGARFYLEYGAIVGKHVDEGLADVNFSVSAAKGSGGSSGGDPGGSGGDPGTGPARPDGPDNVTNPPDGRDPPPEDPRPPARGPDDRKPPDPKRRPEPLTKGSTVGDTPP